VSNFTINKVEATHLATQLTARRSLRFTNMHNRNWVAKIARDNGLYVRKTSTKNQVLDPRYTVEGSKNPDLGLGNNVQWFPTLYMIEVAEKPAPVAQPVYRARYDYRGGW
jgi:hypothetical protein